MERRTASDALGGLIPHARFTTMMILLINTGLYVAMLLHGSQPSLDFDGRTVFDFGGKQGPAILIYGQWWRLVTAGFLHGGLLHILMNSWVLFDLGAQTEESYGTPRYLWIYFGSTVTGFTASLFWAPDALSSGASAGICGLVGAMIALGVRDRSSFGTDIRNFYMRYVIYVLLMCFLPFAIDNAAHIGGLIGGFVLGYIAGTPGYSRTLERFWQVAAGFACLVTAISFYKMFVSLLATTR